MNLENVKREDWILAGVALLLIIDLVALPWFSVGGGSVGGISIPSFDFTATDTPDGWLGVLAVIATAAVIADLAIERFSPQTQVPNIGGSRAMTRFVLAVAAAVFVALKFLFHIHFSIFGFGFWAGIVLTAGLVFVALQARQTESVMPSAAAPPPPASPTPPAGSAGPPTV